MDYEWLENGEYWVHVEDMRSSIMRDAMAAKTEAQTVEAFQRQLYYYIRLKTGVELDFKQETPIKGGLAHDFGVLKSRTSGRGRLDAVINNLIIEYKKHSKLNNQSDQETARNQVKDYLKTLFDNEGIKYNAILTDGIKISYFGFNGNSIESTAFKNIDAKDIDRIIRAILSNNCKKFMPENILKDFAVNSETDSISKDLAVELYTGLIREPTEKTSMLFSEWESLMHLSYDDNGKGNDIEKRRAELSLIFRDNINNTAKEYKAIFALQTAYAIIVKLIACKVIDKLDYGTSTKSYTDLTKVTAAELQGFLEDLEDGYVYRSSDIINLLEGDFFSWYATKEQWNANVSDLVLNKESSFDDVKKYLVFGTKIAAQMSDTTSAFSYLSDTHDFRCIIGESSYEFRTGVEFTPQELYMLVGMGASKKTNHYRFGNKKFARSKYIVDDMPKNGWDLPTEYIYPIVTGPSITPFKCGIENEYCIFPYSETKTDAPISVPEMMNENPELFDYLLKHQNLIARQSEKSKDMHRGEEFYALSKIGPYTFSKYLVAARDNTKFCATVIKASSTPWGEMKQSICVKHTMIIGRDHSGRFITEEEAHYINGILNSEIVIEYMQNTFKSNGYSLKKSRFYLPIFDGKNDTHKKISQLSMKATATPNTDGIKTIQKQLSALYIKMCDER